MLNRKVFLSFVAASAIVTTAFATSDSVWIDNTNTSKPQDSIRIGKDANVGQPAAIAIGKNAEAEGYDSTSVGKYSSSKTRGTSVGSYAYTEDSATAVGINAQAQAYQSVALGEDSTAKGEASMALGSNSIANGNGAIAVGFHAEAQSDDAVAIGKYTESQSRGTSIGTYSTANTASTAVGINAQAKAENSVAIGTDSSATANNSVALGMGSVANELNTVSVGSATNKRRITNVADGINDTDAVNLRQLNSVRDEARAGIASAMALAPAALPEPGKTSLNLGLAGFKGEGATSVNVNHRMIHHNTDLTLGLGVSADTEKNVGVRASLGIIF